MTAGLMLRYPSFPGTPWLSSWRGSGLGCSSRQRAAICAASGSGRSRKKQRKSEFNRQSRCYRSASLGITASRSSRVGHPLSRKASAPAVIADARSVAYIVSTTILMAGHPRLIIWIVAMPFSFGWGRTLCAVADPAPRHPAGASAPALPPANHPLLRRQPR